MKPYFTLFRNNADARPHERQNHWKAVAGYSIAAGADTVIVANYLHEEEKEEGHSINLAEIGVRRMVNPLTVLALGVGFGLDDDSPDVRVTFGFQKSF